MKGYFRTLNKVNTPCEDDGEYFTEPTRVNNIKALLSKSKYKLLKEGGLSLIYKHKNYKEDKPTLLISCHIDSCYSKHHHSDYNKEEMLGTFDNSICNAILIYKMINDELPSNVLIAFTGGEERGDEGAQETADYLKTKKHIWEKLKIVIVLDVTAEEYNKCPFTIENFFWNKNNKLHFDSHYEFGKYLKKILSDFGKIKLINSDKADEDESWEYDDFELNCFSFCFPTRPHPDNKYANVSEWMHDDKGIIIKKENIARYSKGLSALLQNINKDLT